MSKSEIALLAAINRGPLIYQRSNPHSAGGACWRFGRRWFRAEDVNEIIARGLAVRMGKKVVKA